MIGNLNQIVVMFGASPALFLVAKGTVVVALGLIAVWLARNSRAAVRHALLAAVFGVLLALPVVSVIATPVRIAVPVTADHSMTLPLFDDIAAPASGALRTAPHNDAGAKQGLPQIHVSTVLLYGWLIGGVIFALLTMRGMLQVRVLHRFALPWRQGQAIAEELAPGIHRRVDVLMDEKLTGPLTCGVRRPAIILPADAEAWNRQDLDRALIHELEHVRRHDWTVHCLARIACAAYWFHPLVWVAWRQLTLEAERSCDDAVLRRSEAIAYADQLLGLARRVSGGRKLPALAMANRSDLSARVGALLDGRQRRGPVGAALIAAACIGAAVIVLAMSPLRMVAAPQANTSPAVQNIPKWDAVSIKRCANPPAVRTEGQGAGAAASPDRQTWNCLNLSTLINGAYSIFADGHTKIPPFAVQIEHLPSWANSELYTVEAKAQGEPGSEMMRGPMLQALLEDRFALKLHPETREGRAYTLTVAKSGVKMPPFQGGCTPPDFVHPQPVAPNQCRGSQQANGLNRTFEVAGFDLDSFAQFMANFGGLDGPIHNETGLSGFFHIHLEYSLDLKPGDPGYKATDEPLFPSIFTAVEQQLGLTLKPGKGTHKFLVVDHIEKPTEN